MRVLILTNSKISIDGWSYVSQNLIRNLKIFKPIVYSYSDNKIISHNLRLTKLNFLTPLIVICDFIFISLRIKKIPDVIHCNSETFAPLGFFLSRIYKKPYTITSHGTYSNLLPKKSWFYKIAFKNADLIFSVSSYTKEKMLNFDQAYKIKVINPGVNKKKFKINNNSLRKNNIIFVGNEKKRKGLYFLLKACLEIPPYLINELILIGYFSFKDININKLLKKLKRKGIKIKILTNISVSELVKYYQKAKVNVLPSQNVKGNFEGFGLIHLEANACGTLSIGCKNSGNEDAIKDGYGFLVPQENYKKLSQKIKEILYLKKYPKLKINEIKSWSDFSREYEKEWIKFKKH